ncbi:MAG: hypothetical protein ACTSVV_03570, partial [Promethearchaeota archaeon]
MSKEKQMRIGIKISKHGVGDFVNRKIDVQYSRGMFNFLTDRIAEMDKNKQYIFYEGTNGSIVYVLGK